MKAIERKKKIMELLGAKESVEVLELTRLFSVSKVTVRKDLDDLELKGLVVRTHGGAVLAEKQELVRRISSTLSENIEKKKKINSMAASMVKPRQNIIIDSGSTTVHLARFLADCSLTVITNSILVIQELMGAEHIELIVAGGIIRRPSMSLIGLHTCHAFEQLHADILFLGASGFSLENGITCTNLIEAETKRAMIRSASKVCLLADSTKFEKIFLAKICDWDSIDILITDEILPQARSFLEDKGVQIVC